MREEKTANIPASEDYIGCWSTDGAAAVIRPSGSRFEVILETYDCGPDGFIYGYLCDYREEEGVLEACGTGIKRFSGWDEAREQEIAQTEYEDGSAVFQINEEGLLIWKDRTGNAGEGLLFSGMGDFEGTWVCGGISIDFYPIGGIYDCLIEDAEKGCSWRYFCGCWGTARSAGKTKKKTRAKTWSLSAWKAGGRAACFADGCFSPALPPGRPIPSR